MIDDVDQFLEIFDQYSREECADFIAALLLEVGFELAELSPAAQNMFAEFAVRAGVVPGASAPETAEVVRAYFAAHPLNPALVREFKNTARAELLLNDPGILARSASRWVAAGEKKTFQSREAPSPHSVGRGALGFFAAKKKTK
jgi:hypothetical protein